MKLRECVYQKLDELKIDYSVINHKAMFSESDANLEIFQNNVTIGKNLFLRNKNKKKYYLVMLPLTKKINLNSLAEKLHETRFSFSNESELDDYLKIFPGSVSYLNVITSKKLGGNFENITYIIDKELMDSELVAFHPSDNTASVITQPEIITRILENYALKYDIIEL